MSGQILSPLQVDALAEIGNIGAGNAATSLSQLLHRKIRMSIPEVKVINYDELMNLLGGPDEVIVALLFEVSEDLPCTIYFILSIEEAQSLIRSVTKMEKFEFLHGIHANPLAESALKEMGNIVISSYLAALADFTNLTIYPSIPHLAVDMVGAILTVGILETSQASDHVISITTGITSDSAEKMEGHFLLLPESKSLQTLFQALGIDHD